MHVDAEGATGPYVQLAARHGEALGPLPLGNLLRIRPRRPHSLAWGIECSRDGHVVLGRVEVGLHHTPSTSSARFPSESFHPSLASLGGMDLGIPSWQTVISVPTGTSLKVTVTVITPAISGSSVSN